MLTTTHIRIAFTFVLLVGSLRGDAAAAAEPSSPAASAASMKALRQKAAERRRRIIFNNDGGDVVRNLKDPTVESLLKQRTNNFPGTQIDTLFYCTKATGLDLFTHHTKIGTVFTRRDGGYDTNQTGAFLDKGIDPLRVMIDFGRQHDIEVFWSIRMNDNHDGSSAEYGPINLDANRFKTAHPEFMFGTKKKRPKYGSWTSLDFGEPQVREHAFRLIEEVCQNYDVDGVELDFFRHPVFFRSTTRGELATDEDRAAMTELVMRIRKMADEVGAKRGRPILIAIRVPDSVDYCRAIGLDLEKWLASDMTDLLVLSSYFQLNEWDYSVALGHKYGVKVFPSLDESRLKDAAAMALRRNEPTYRARAADVWRSGADGVYLFNYPFESDPKSTLIKEMGSVETLAKLDKDYFASVRGAMRSSGGNLPYEPYMKIEALNSDNAKIIEPGEKKVARLGCSEDFEQNADAKLTLRLKLTNSQAAEPFRVTVNGQSVKVRPSADGWLEGEPTTSQMRLGTNTVVVALSDKAKEAAIWTDLVLQVRYPKGK